MDTECCICGECFATAPAAPADHPTEDVVIIKHSNDQSLDVSRKRGHYFHRGCLEQWKKVNNSCPLDRDGIARVYTVPGYRVRGIELKQYGHDLRVLLLKVKVTDNLLDQFKDIDEVDKDNRTLTFHACRFGNYALVCKLLKRGADCNRPCGSNGFTPLMAAVCYNHLKVVQKILSHRGQDRNKSVNATDGHGYTAFNHACELGYYSIIKEFLIRRIIPTNQLRYLLERYRAAFKCDTLFGGEIISMFQYYLQEAAQSY